MCTYPYMPRLRDRRVLDEGVLDMPMLWQTDAFALAAAYDEAQAGTSGCGRREFSTSAPVVNDAMLLVRPDVAQPQLDEEIKPAALPVDPEDRSAGVLHRGPAGGPRQKGQDPLLCLDHAEPGQGRARLQEHRR